MKKLLSILVLSLLLSGNASAEIITFSKCYNVREGEFKFRDDLYEQRSYVIDYNKGIVEYISILTDNYFKDLLEKNPDSGQRKYYFMENKIDTFNDLLVKTRDTIKANESNIITFEYIYDLKTKKIQKTTSYSDINRKSEVLFIQCQ